MFSRDSSNLRLLIGVSALLLVFVSQAYWFTSAWSLFGRVKSPGVRRWLRGLCVATFGLLALALYLNLFYRRHRTGLPWHSDAVMALTGLWLSSALFSYFSMKLVGLAVWLWDLLLRTVKHRSRPIGTAALENPERRQFVRAATVVAGSLPFVAGLYGFAFERLRFIVRSADLPIANLPAALDGMTIAQISDIHASIYMPIAQVRRAVDMTNALGADLTVVTGDFITGVDDPLEECIAELSRLRAPMGVWGCNGNHEIYAGAEAKAQQLFGIYGMRLLRQQSDTVEWRGQPINLIGVDYESSYDKNGKPRVFLTSIESLVRRDMPNILLSHNPNTFPRSAELGIELMLTGHTHGGQIRVEILHRQLSPARFLTPFVAGLYSLPLGIAPRIVSPTGAPILTPPPDGATNEAPNRPKDAVLYVNRGLGTIGMPIRLGVPPEITLHTLRRA